MLATSTSETGQMVDSSFKAPGFREVANGASHGLVGYLQESQCDLLGGVLRHALFRSFLIDLLCHLVEQLGGHFGIKRLVFGGTKDVREVFGQQATEEQIGVSHTQRASFTVTCWSGVGASRLGADVEQAVSPGQDGATASCHGVDVQLG